MAGLVLELHPGVVLARVHVGPGVVAHLPRVALAVGEGEGSPERTLDQLALLTEHGVEGGVAVNGVAEILHRINLFLAIA